MENKACQNYNISFSIRATLKNASNRKYRGSSENNSQNKVGNLISVSSSSGKPKPTSLIEQQVFALFQ